MRNKIAKSQENLKNIIDELFEENDFKKINGVKKVIDELDMFSNDITFSKVGDNYSNFLKQLLVKKGTKESELQAIAERMVKILHFNKSILEKIENVTISSGKIVKIIILFDKLGN